MEMFTMKVRSKGQYKLARTKVCKIVEGKTILSP